MINIFRKNTSSIIATFSDFFLDLMNLKSFIDFSENFGAFSQTLFESQFCNMLSLSRVNNIFFRATACCLAKLILSYQAIQ